MSNLKFYISLLTINLLSNDAFASEPKPWQMDLQPPSGIIAETATDLHNFLLVVITLISLFVLALLVYVCWRYKENSKFVSGFLEIYNGLMF